MTKQDKYTKSARGQECQIRLPGCNFDNDTTVFAHLNGAGMGTKHLSIHGSYACSNCHDIVDGRKKSTVCRDTKIDHLEGVVRTQIIMVRDGVLKL